MVSAKNSALPNRDHLIDEVNDQIQHGTMTPQEQEVIAAELLDMVRHEKNPAVCESAYNALAIVDDKTGLYNGGFVVLACFDGDDKSGNPKVYFHDYSSAKRVEWADRYILPSFSDWLRVAEEESAQFRADLEDEDD